MYTYYPEFAQYAQGIRTGLSFEVRTGPPDEITSGIGYVALGFSHLEDSVNRAIEALLGTDPNAASIVLAEVSFRAKVNILGSLVHDRAPFRYFNARQGRPVEAFSEISSLMFRAEELRNQVMHSSWEGPLAPGAPLDALPITVVRRKVTAKAHRGLRIADETLSGADLLDIYDFTLNVAWALDEFFLGFEEHPS